MPESTAKKQLLRESFTPAKVLVARDINSWLQTHEKDRASLASKNAKFKINKIVSKSSVVNQRASQQNSRQSTPNIEQLKRRKEELLKTISHKKNAGSSSQNTKPNTADNSSGGDRNNMEWFMKLPLVHVNEFMADERDRGKFQKITLVPEAPLFPKCSPITNRKTSLRKADRVMDNKSAHFLCPPGKKLKGLSTEVNNLIQQKLMKNNYTGLLSSISRKTSNVLVTVQQEANKIRP